MALQPTNGSLSWGWSKCLSHVLWPWVGTPWRQTWRVSPGGTSDASDHRIWDVKNPVVNTGINYYPSLNWFSRRISEASTMLIHINNNPQPAILLLKNCCTKLFASWHLEIWNSKLFASFFSFLKKGRFREIFPFSSKVSPSFLAHLFSPAWRSLEALTAQRRYYKIQSRKRYYAGKPGDFFWAVECRLKKRWPLWM